MAGEAERCRCSAAPPEGPSHGFIVHVWLVLVFAPQLGNSLGIHQLEDALLPLGPLDVPGTRVLVLKEV